MFLEHFFCVSARRDWAEILVGSKCVIMSPVTQSLPASTPLYGHISLWLFPKWFILFVLLNDECYLIHDPGARRPWPEFCSGSSFYPRGCSCTALKMCCQVIVLSLSLFHCLAPSGNLSVLCCVHLHCNILIKHGSWMTEPSNSSVTFAQLVLKD